GYRRACQPQRAAWQARFSHAWLSAATPSLTTSPAHTRESFHKEEFTRFFHPAYFTLLALRPIRCRSGLHRHLPTPIPEMKTSACCARRSAFRRSVCPFLLRSLLMFRTRSRALPKPTSRSARRRSAPPGLERLEDRCTPTGTVTITSLQGP